MHEAVEVASSSYFAGLDLSSLVEIAVKTTISIQHLRDTYLDKQTSVLLKESCQSYL